MFFELEPGEDTILHSYLPTSVHDWTLIDLWGKMQQDGSLASAMMESAQSLLSFVQLLAKPDTRFALDQQGPYFAAWCEPVMSGISLGLWVREDKRSSRICLELGHKVIIELFKKYSTIIVITRDETTKRFHQHFGFQYGCMIPFLFDGNTAYISFLTKEDYWKRFINIDSTLEPKYTAMSPKDIHDMSSFYKSLAEAQAEAQKET